MEVWMKQGVTIEETIETQALRYRENHPGKISLVLGAGNASALQVADLLNKLYVENQVVLLKMNPVNAYLVVEWMREGISVTILLLTIFILLALIRRLRL
jgi:hypothetical protein